MDVDIWICIYVYVYMDIWIWIYRCIYMYVYLWGECKCGEPETGLSGPMSLFENDDGMYILNMMNLCMCGYGYLYVCIYGYVCIYICMYIS
jgi:hypothetical protein